MKARLTDFLTCPECSGTLHLRVEHYDATLPWEEVVEGQLVCESCDRRYAVSRGVPRLIGGPLSEAVEKTVTGFGYEWQKFDEQIADTYMTGKANFLDFITPVTPDYFLDKIVLDAGCGMGRFLMLAADFGSREVIGVDLSHSVDVAYQHVRHLPNAHVIQADIMALPLKRAFDFIFSVGVLQFLERPQAGFDRLTSLLHDDGAISVWVYARENNDWVMRLITPLRKHVTSRLPRPILYGLSHCLGLPLYALIQLIYKRLMNGSCLLNWGVSCPTTPISTTVRV